MKRIFGILITIIIFQVGCTDDDDNSLGEFPPLDRGTIEANRLEITFNPSNDPNNKTTFEFYDPDGIGGNAPTVNETIILDNPIGMFLNYDATVKIYQDEKDVTDDIRTLGTAYVICYRGMDTRDLRLTGRNLDSQGRELGLDTDFVTVDEDGLANPSDDAGPMTITLNYQINGKDGTCDAGIRILEAQMNYQLN